MSNRIGNTSSTESPKKLRELPRPAAGVINVVVAGKVKPGTVPLDRQRQEVLVARQLPRSTFPRIAQRTVPLRKVTRVPTRRFVRSKTGSIVAETAKSTSSESAENSQTGDAGKVVRGNI